MQTLLLLLTLWPFTAASPLNHGHSRAYHARQLAHLQAARAKSLARQHRAAHPSLLHF